MKFQQIAAGRSHCIALAEGSAVYQWGSRQFLEPKRLVLDSIVGTKDAPSGDTVVQVSAGENSSAFVTSNGFLYTWGKNLMSKALGHGSGTGFTQPKKVDTFPEGTAIAA